MGSDIATSTRGENTAGVKEYRENGGEEERWRSGRGRRGGRAGRHGDHVHHGPHAAKEREGDEDEKGRDDQRDGHEAEGEDESGAQRLGVQVFGWNRLRGGAQHSKVLPGADASRGLREEVSVQEEETQVGGGRGSRATEAGMSWLEGRSDCI